MEGDSKNEKNELIQEQDDIEPESEDEISSHLSIFRILFFTVWIRCSFCCSNETDRFLLDYGYILLFYFGLFFWLIFLYIQC